MNNEDIKNLPVVYACAGCSGAGQIAYKMALELNKKGMAEMSCLAGLASKQKSFLHKIKNRAIWIIDGCPINCSKAILQNMNLSEAKHIRLDTLGIKKNEDPENVDIEKLIEGIQSENKRE